MKAGDLALTMTMALFYVMTRGGSKNWPWLYIITYLLDNSSSEQHPSVLPYEAPNPNTLQAPKSWGQLLLLKDDFGPDIIHVAPS